MRPCSAVLVPVPQVALRRDGGEWRFLIEKELRPQDLEEFMTAAGAEIRIYGVGSDCQRLKERLNTLGIGFQETKHLTNQPITEQASVAVIHDINVDETLVRAACKIVFNYAAKVLGAEIIRVVDALGVAVGAEVDGLVARRDKLFEDAVAQLHASVVECDRNLHPGVTLPRMSDLERWRELGQQLRVDAVRASDKAGSGHPTSSMSAAGPMP